MIKTITEILDFREDISPFLIHLTKSTNEKSAAQILTQIIQDKHLKQSKKPISVASYAGNTLDFSEEKQANLFCAICFTETPINQAFCLFDIKYRQIELSNYGLVFLKDKLIEKGVSPVLYFNTYNSFSADVIYLLFNSFLTNKTFYNDNKDTLHKIFPLISLFGNTLDAVTGKTTTMDFLWEREWRYPYCCGDYELVGEDIFVGLCDEKDIKMMETLAQNALGTYIPFIDPEKNIKQYAKKLIDRRDALGLTVSVV